MEKNHPVLIGNDIARIPGNGIPLYQCPEGDAIDFPATWYASFEAPDFTICSYCYNAHINRTIFRNKFFDRIEQPDANRRCLFNTLQARKLWKESLASESNWLSLTNFMRTRAQLPNCRGTVGVSGVSSPPTRWYSMRGDEIPSFLVCAACHEDVVCATVFKDHFRPHPTIRAEHETWSCALAVPYIRRAIGKLDTWSGFVESTVARLRKAPCCRSTVVEVGSRTWYTARPLIAGVLLCDTCYDDIIAFTWLEGQFDRYIFRSEHSSHRSKCSMASLPLRVSLIERSKGWSCRNLWWQTAQKVLKSPPCSPEENSSWAWFTPTGCGASGFRVCLQCYTGMIDALGHASAFVNYQPALDPIPPKPGEKRLCGFNPASPRFHDYIQYYVEAIFTHDWTKFKDYIWRFARLPLCPGLQIVHDRFWFGSEDFMICESCFEEFVERSDVAIQLPYQRKQMAEGFCVLATPRMRQLWQEACEKHDLSGFAAFAKYRAAIYLELISLNRSYSKQNPTAFSPPELTKRMTELNRKWKEME